MFRGMRRFKQAVSEEECRKVLAEAKRAVFSVIGDNGYPYSVPINFYYDEKDNRIYFHGAKEGHKIDAIRKCDKVCFTTWNTGYREEGHWEWNVTSVIIFGRARMIEDREVKEDKLRRLALKYYPTEEEVEKALVRSMERAQLYVVEIEHMTGKLVKEK